MMDHICFHVVVSSNEAVSRLLANSILLCDIKDYHSMRAGKKKKNHSKTAQREELLETERTINSNLYLMSKRTEQETGKDQGQPVTDFTMRIISTYASVWRLVQLICGGCNLIFCYTGTICH